MEFMDELSSMMMLVMIKDMMFVHNVGDVICDTFHPKNPNVQTHKQSSQHVCLSSL
jgi:hypothetical protein